ncbi:biotin--[acetyl-CoA-carboxylase] ligase [Roseobacter sp. HKCCA0434]|uniref:biotin--[acetyl-CoA-carboxylase] ligase n=1 Tax=Roseobacter sp. HKCCA0434 TaxID=3079297 RepID=UPI0029059994|nr:biotin--[acetyl-CoA-carboxylase] ligase [Roseobacter sp. HKCCA0434]
MEVWPQGTGRLILDETGSTQGEAFARAGDAPIWVMAHRQTAATGRRGRAWAMPDGNFAATLAIRPDGPVARRALRSFIAALALRDALIELTGQPALFTLKWPNDVLCRERKLAGILLESRGDVLLVGIGVNLVAAPPQVELEPGASLATDLLSATGMRYDPEALLDPLARSFAAREARLAQEGFGPQQAEWMRGAARIGEQMTARLVGREVTGRFDGIDADGALLLATATGIERLPAAEIYFHEGG